MCYKIHQVNILFTAFQWKHYILLPLESYENFCFSIFTYGRGFPRPFCSFPSTMCLHMACFNKQKIEALKLKFSITFKCQQYRFKAIFGGTLRSRKMSSQKAESFVKAMAMNKMTRLGMPKGVWL